MTEPILTREEVQEIERKCDITFFVPDDSETFPGTYINLRQLRDYAARIEAAVLEKVCGEPVGFVTNVDGYWHMEPIVNWEQIGLSTRLYALTRSKP